MSMAMASTTLAASFEALDAAPAIGWVELALAALLILLNAGVSLVFRLGLGRMLLVSTVRAGLQLGLLGLVLHWVFALELWIAVVALMLAMGTLAGIEAARRAAYRVPGLARTAIVGMVASSMLVTFYATSAVLRVEPWYAPRFVLPILGMILGNAMNGVSLGLDAALDGFTQKRDAIDTLLAHGATPQEATRDVVRNAVRRGTIPILNAMAAAGAISIPGMMTGQILAGESPARAAAYQAFILFCIAGSTALGTVGVVLGSRRLVFDTRGRLRADRIQSHE